MSSDSKNVGIYKGNPMNKNILAIAIAAAVAAPSAFAAATVYGVAHMSYGSVNNVDKDSASASAATGDNYSQNNLSSNASRIGIKGSEDLGGGLKAVYQYETTIGFDGDTNGGQGGMGTQRNTFAGIGGGFGTVMFGLHDTPVKLISRKYDMFGDQIGDTRNFTAGNGTGVNFDARPANVIAYSSPVFNGFSALVAYVNDESGASDKPVTASATGTKYSMDTSAMSASLNYKLGKFEATAGYESHGKGFTQSSTNTAPADKALAAVRVGATYDFGMVKVNALYANQDIRAAADSVKARDIYGIGAGVKVGAAGTVKAQYYVAGKYNNVKNGADLFAVGYDHAMSKNTTVYAAYATVNNQEAASYSVNGGGGHGASTGVNVGKDPAAFSVGLIHKF
jgi:predicted porin